MIPSAFGYCEGTTVLVAAAADCSFLATTITAAIAINISLVELKFGKELGIGLLELTHAQIGHGEGKAKTSDGLAAVEEEGGYG